MSSYPKFLLEKNLARQALESGDRQTAWRHLMRLIKEIEAYSGTFETDSLFVSGSLELANISFVLGKGFSELIDILQKTLKTAARIGDRRSAAMINLHLGRLLYFAQQRETAMSLFLSGKNEVEALGDDDILTQAAEFLGLFYFIQGRFKEAIGYFEKAAKSFESETAGRIVNPSGPLWLSYCAAFLGQFHRAIGTLDYYRRLAVEGADRNLATTLRAVLGIILLGIKRNREACFHLSGAMQEARHTHNDLAGYFAMGGLAFHHYLEGRLREASDWIHQTATAGAKSGLIHQYASPLVLETLFELHRQGNDSEPGLNYALEYDRIMREPNIHLRGVACRLSAIDAMDKKKPADEIEAILTRSERFLEASGDPIQLGKTQLEMARMSLLAGGQEKARQLAEKARKNFGSYMEMFFPDDLLPLLTLKSDMARNSGGCNDLIGMFADMIQDLSPSSDFETLLSRTVMATNRFFGAERGGIFWFHRPPSKKGPSLRGACNLFTADLADEAFKPGLTVVFKAYRENRPQIVRKEAHENLPSRVKALLCVPFSVENRVRGVLYHDNSYMHDCFDNFDITQLTQMARWLTSYIDQIFEFSRQMEKQTAENLSQMEPPGRETILTQSPAMAQTLDQAGRIADADSTVLISGETGAGKELLARRIHEKSPRSDKPMVIVDATVIPENLAESELFGHEKGAFTGADRQKKGRIELAHQGTLFIDEVSELPRSMQAKLLRAIQEKTTMRIGGNKPIFSDFRLIAATNRDLAAEVAAGNFREDLFFRLNVIPITLPPLRERREDIILLARHFWGRFSHKYNRRDVEMTGEDEALLNAYDWPGNIREMQNVMERAVLLSAGGRLHLDLPTASRTNAANPFEDLPTIDDLQRRYISHVLNKTDGKMSGPGGAAEILGMKRTSLYNRMKKLGLR